MSSIKIYYLKDTFFLKKYNFPKCQGQGNLAKTVFLKILASRSLSTLKIIEDPKEI